MWSHVLRSLHESVLTTWSRRPETVFGLLDLRIDLVIDLVSDLVSCLFNDTRVDIELLTDLVSLCRTELSVLSTNALSSPASSLAPRLCWLQYTLTGTCPLGSLKLVAPCR
mmetsp:Transcript_74549/g.205477  ORF Transcript_74549/g.205477 Transcript_74549/m.205477 type:complete len:111 (+) Transcript_74549:12-344(+)